MNYTVIVVDDEKLIAKNIARTIETVNPQFKVVAVCSGGQEAWDCIKQMLPHVVFTDISMPEMDGLELAQKIYEEYPFITCAIVSGYNSFDYAKQAMKYMVNDYILKPVNREELSECLKRIEKKIQVQYPNLLNSSDHENGERSPEEIVKLVEEYILKNFQDPIDLTSISRSLGFSSSYLTKVFVKYSGITPSRYLRNYRITVSKQLLNDPRLSLSAIASQTGFADQFHFSKTFKAVTGTSPSEYRQCVPGEHTKTNQG